LIDKAKFKIGERVVFWPNWKNNKTYKGSLRPFSKSDQRYFKIFDRKIENNSD